jgi:hypothetical protein
LINGKQAYEKQQHRTDCPGSQRGQNVSKSTHSGPTVDVRKAAVVLNLPSMCRVNKIGTFFTTLARDDVAIGTQNQAFARPAAAREETRIFNHWSARTILVRKSGRQDIWTG